MKSSIASLFFLGTGIFVLWKFASKSKTTTMAEDVTVDTEPGATTDTDQLVSVIDEEQDEPTETKTKQIFGIEFPVYKPERKTKAMYLYTYPLTQLILLNGADDIAAIKQNYGTTDDNVAAKQAALLLITNVFENNEKALYYQGTLIFERA